MSGGRFRSVLVTGANGFVGRRLVEAFRGFDPTNLTLCCGPHDGKAPDGYRSLNLSDAGAVGSLICETRPDLVIHLAGQSSVGQSGSASEATWEVNFVGTFRLAEAIKRYAPGCTVFFTSSADVYGAAFNDGVASEEGSLKPRSVYAHTKAAAESVLADVLGSDTRLIVVRPSNHSGSGQDVRFVLPSFARQIAEAEAGLRPTVIKVGNLDAERDFMDVNDVVGTYVQLLGRSSRLPMHLVVNVASGNSISVRTLLNSMLGMTALRIRVEVDQERVRPSDIPVAKISIGRLRDLGIVPPKAANKDLLSEILEDQRSKIRNLM